MLLFLKKLFGVITKIDRFLHEDQIKNHNGFTLIMYAIILISLIGTIIQKNLGSEMIIKFATSIFGLFFYITLPYMIFKSDGLRQYIFWGKKKTFEEISKEFTLKSYVAFVIFFSYFILIPILGITVVLDFYKINILSNLVINHINTILYINVISASFFWFSYHIVESKIPLQKIKIRVSLFNALGTTFILIFNSDEFKNLLFVMSCLLLSYRWVQYLLELKSEENRITQIVEEQV